MFYCLIKLFVTVTTTITVIITIVILLDLLQEQLAIRTSKMTSLSLLNNGKKFSKGFSIIKTFANNTTLASYLFPNSNYDHSISGNNNLSYGNYDDNNVNSFMSPIDLIRIRMSHVISNSYGDNDGVSLVDILTRTITNTVITNSPCRTITNTAPNHIMTNTVTHTVTESISLPSVWFSSTMKKRRLKMNKHKLKKRRKALKMNTKVNRQ